MGYKHQLVRKADLAISDLQSDGGYLPPEAAKTFIRTAIKTSKFLSMVRVVPMKSPIHQVSGLGFNSRVLRPGTSGEALDAADRVKPDLAKVELTSKLYKASVYLPDEVVEDNIENGRLSDAVMEQFKLRLGYDVEDLVLNGDTASGDALYATLDGVRKQITSNQVDVAGAAIATDDFSAMIRQLPDEHRSPREMLRFFVHHDVEEDYRESLAARDTALGDRYLTEDLQVRRSGILIEPLSSIPTNLGVGTNESEALLLKPKNVIVGIQRQIRIQSDYDIDAGMTKFVADLRMDVKVFQEEACVKAHSILVA